jgi:hypothetical protein
MRPSLQVDPEMHALIQNRLIYKTFPKSDQRPHTTTDRPTQPILRRTNEQILPQYLRGEDLSILALVQPLRPVPAIYD